MADDRMTVTLLSWRDGKEIHLAFEEGERLISVVRRAGHMPDGVLVFDDEGPLPLDETLGQSYEGKTLKVVRVASGG